MMEAFSVQESSGEEEEERSNSDKMWDRHIERINKKNKNT